MGIIGKIGSGKSTLAELLCRLIDPTSGYIKFGNDRLGALNLNQLRSHIGYVPQESFLFSDTIFHNIAFGHKNATDLQVLDAAKSALIYDNIMTFKENFNTVVGERGVTLSGGQNLHLSKTSKSTNERKCFINWRLRANK